MKAFTSYFSPRKTRIGFHYYPDMLHYQKGDLLQWLPELKDLNASWLVLQASTERAVPEFFIRGLLEAGIEPLLHFNTPPFTRPAESELKPLLTAYAHWGVRAVILTECPNSRSNWSSSKWAQTGLVERFLDNYIPIANLALQCGLIPILPPLEPGGSYWDTTFLRSMLESLERRQETRLLQNLILSAYAWTGGHSLNWGAGGPERWPAAKPYHTPVESEDNCGFRIGEWYGAICKAVTGKTAPVILLNAGIPGNPYQNPATQEDLESLKTNLAITKLLMDEPVETSEASGVLLNPISEEVVACNFWLLTAGSAGAFTHQAWYAADGKPKASTEAIKAWLDQPRQKKSPVAEKNTPLRKDFYKKVVKPSPPRPIHHYLLLPTYEWGVADFHLDVIRSFVKKYQPTIGFSLKEAALAEQVTVIGGPQSFPESILERLRESGCIVERIAGDGTSIATQLSER